MNRKQITILLLVVLCIAVSYAWIATPKQRRITPGQSPSQQMKLQQKENSTAAFPTVADLDFGSGENKPYQKPQKNLFAPLYPPPAVKPRPLPRPVAKVTKPVVRPQKVSPVIVQGPKPIQPLDVLGYLNKAGVFTVFLASRQGDVYLVKAGDDFADDLMVNSISSKEITIGRMETGQQVILPLGETKSQRLPGIRLKSDRPKFKMPTETAPTQSETGSATEPGNKKVDK